MGGCGRDMNDSELEDGEACSNKTHKDYDVSIDPDVSLSYIDVKIQDVLGHFQKDFENEVSFETLGRKFGGYGSFLSANQCSPPWSQPKTPQVQSYNAQRSPNNVGPECGQGNTTVSSIAHQTFRQGSSCTKSMGLFATKAPLTNNSNKEECIPTLHLDSFASNQESACKKTTSTLNQKRLKFRIKMVQENLPTQKNAAIYTGLGLDVSPSLSYDESQFEREGISREPEDGSSESPSSILQIMTSLPVLLSPLCDDLILLARKGTYARDNIVPTSGNYLETSDMSVHVSDFVKGDRKALQGKKMKPKPRADFSVEFNGRCKKRFQNVNGIITQKELESSALNCTEIVSKTISLPLISNLHADADDSSKDTERRHDNLNEASHTIVREKAFSDQITKKHASYAVDAEFIEEAKVSDGKVVNINNGSVEDHLVNEVKENHRKRERSYNPLIDCKGRKVLLTESTALAGKIHRKASYGQDRTGLPIDKENLYSDGKKKSKENSHVSVQKETTQLTSSLLPKVNKESEEGSYSSENDTADVRVQKHRGKSRDRYRAVTGDLEEQKDRRGLSGSLDENNPRYSEIVGRSMVAKDSAKKFRNSNKKQNRPTSSDRYLKTAAAVNHCLVNGSVKDADPGEGVLGTGATVVAEDNWVQCDRCQKWRLLPVGKNPDDLPDKWLCSMLDWLPALNSCSISEDETKEAVISLYQVPLPEGQNNHMVIGGSISTGGAISTIKNHGQHAKARMLQAIPSGKKKLGGVVSNGATKDGLGHLTTSFKKNLQPSVRRGSLNDVNKSPLDSDIAEEKHKNVQKSTEELPDKGEASNLKLKRRLDSDQNVLGAKKKCKTEKTKSTNQKQILDYNGATLKMHQRSSDNFQITSPSQGQLKKEEWPSSKDSIHNTKERQQVTVKKQRDRSQGSLNEGSLDMGHGNRKDSTKKRNMKEYQDTQTYMGSVQSKGQQELEAGVYLQDGISGNACRREKKARSQSDIKESHTIKGNARTDKKESHAINKEFRKDMGNMHLPWAVDGMDCVKRDSGSLQDPAAATSSSSMLSGSHRTKASFWEVKGSPVESVSSSPMRNLNLDYCGLSNMEQIGKEKTIRIPRRCLDEEDDGSARSDTIRKYRNSTLEHHRFDKSSASDFQERDFGRFGGIKSKVLIAPSPVATCDHDEHDGLNDVGLQTPKAKHLLSRCEDEHKLGSSKYIDGPHFRKSGKGPSSRLKDKNQNLKPESNEIRVKSFEQLRDRSPFYEAKWRDARTRSQDILDVQSGRSENKNNRGIDSLGELLNGSVEREKKLNNNEHEQSSKRFHSEKSEHVDLVSGRGKSVPLPSSGMTENETLSSYSLSVSSSRKVNGDIGHGNLNIDDEPKIQKKQIRKADDQNVNQQSNSRHQGSPCSSRRDPPTHSANNALKEATDLKHLADRLKNAGSSESTGLYFQAALKFLHGASLLESCNNGNAKQNEVAQSKQVYSSTAKLCEFCAHEYEKAKDMATAALAYKCMEVAYMRIIYSSHANASRDWHELLTALHVVSHGESPSSSASDIDNVNISVMVDKLALTKGISSPQVSRAQIVAARNRPSVIRLLNFTQDVNFAMEASRKSQNAFATVNAKSSEIKNEEVIPSMKEALDFSFQDIEGLLRLVRLAVEAIYR